MFLDLELPNTNSKTSNKPPRNLNSFVLVKFCTSLCEPTVTWSHFSARVTEATALVAGVELRPGVDTSTAFI